MAKYIKVTKEVSDFLGNSEARVKTADGAVLRWQADLNNIPGITLEERAANVGGVVLTPFEAAQERDGTSTPRQVFTPDEYATEDKTENEKTDKEETDGGTDNAGEKEQEEES